MPNLVDSEADPLVSKPESNEKTKTSLHFLLFGMMSLIVYNFFLQSLGYFNTCFGTNFTSQSHIVYAVAANVIQICAVFVGSSVPSSHGIILSCLGLGLVSILFPVFAQREQLVVGLILSSGLGLFCAILQSTGSALAGLSSPESIVYFYMGQSIAGLLPWPMIELMNGLYRCLGSSTVSVGNVASEMDSRTTLTVMCFAGLLSLGFLPYYFLSIDRSKSVGPESHSIGSIWTTFKAMWQWALSAWLLFLTTFSVYPHLPLLWEPSNPRLFPVGGFFYPNMMIYIAIVFDICGMYLPMLGVVMSTAVAVKTCVGIRIVAIPLIFLLCPPNDLLRVLACVVLALSGAFLLSMVLQFGCTSDKPAFSAEVAGYILSFALCNGIVVGSACRWGIAQTYGMIAFFGKYPDH